MVARKSYSLWNPHFEICFPKINLRKDSKKKKDLKVVKILIFAFLNRIYRLTPHYYYVDRSCMSMTMSSFVYNSLEKNPKIILSMGFDGLFKCFDKRTNPEHVRL